MAFRRFATRRCPSGVGNTFAESCPPVPQSILDHAAGMHGGYNVYRNAHQCRVLLNLLKNNGWKKDPCSYLLEQLESIQPQFLVPTAESQVALGRQPYFPIVALEGLDGVGKSTVATNLATKIGGVVKATPDPALDDLRAEFRVAPEPIARLFYCTCNYLAAKDILETRRVQPVIVDRWFASTNAMALAAWSSNQENNSSDGADGDGLKLPVLGTKLKGRCIFAWPTDLPRPDAQFLLNCSEEVRLKRMSGRGGPNREEKALAADRQMRETANEAFRRQGFMEIMVEPNYKVAINRILEELRESSVTRAVENEGREAELDYDAAAFEYGVDVVPYTEEEIAATKPY